MSQMLIKGGSIVTMDEQLGDIAGGDVLIEDGRIAAVGTGLEAGEGAEVIDAAGMIVMPGLVNGHIHTWQTGLRGLGGDWTATNYFRAMHAGLATFFKAEDVYIANLVGALNQINNGVTSIVDWHHCNHTPEHSDAAIDGLEDAGIRAVWLHGSAKPDPKPGDPHYSEIPMNSAEVKRIREGRLSSDDGLVTMGMAVLGPQMSVGDVVLKDFKLAHDLDLVASLHHSGAKLYDPEAYKKAAEQGILSSNINVVHANEMTDADLKLCVDHGVTFVVTAEVEMQMCYTEPITGRLRALGAPVGIGSDIESGYAPDMFAVTRYTLQVERHFDSMREKAKTGERPHPICITTREALNWSLKDSAAMYRIGDRVGALTPGKAADITMLRETDLNLVSHSSPINAIVMHANPGNVDTVIINGKVMKRGGTLLFDGLKAKTDELIASRDRVIGAFKKNSPNVDFL